MMWYRIMLIMYSRAHFASRRLRLHYRGMHLERLPGPASAPHNRALPQHRMWPKVKALTCG